MTIAFDGSGGLFTRLGMLNYGQFLLNGVRLTSVPDEVNDFILEMNGTPELEAVAKDLPQAITNWRVQSDGFMTQQQTAAQRLVIQMVNADSPQQDVTLTTALLELRRQMIANSETLKQSAVGASVANLGTPTGNGVFVTSTKRGDGLTQSHLYSEVIQLQATSASGISVKGEPKARGMLAEDFPGGSGCSTSLAVVSGSGLLTNGSFEDETVLANFPDGWILGTGTVGTTIKITDVEVQTVAISGTPTGGTYRLIYTNASSQVQVTDPIAYNASAATVQTALRKLTGLSRVTVTATGTTPNFTHTITFTGLGGNVTTLTSSSAMTGGTPVITHGTTTTGSTHVYGLGKALEFDSDGSQSTTIYQRVTLAANTCYAFNGFFKVDSVPAAGVLTVDLWDGSAVINDDQATANSFTISAPGLTTSYAAKNGVFRTPRVLPAVVYLRYRISTAVSNTSSVFADQFALAAMTQLYKGGPVAAAFAGSTAFVAGDRWTLTTTNDRAGLLHDWCERNFELSAKGILLPVSGSETIADSLIT